MTTASLSTTTLFFSGTDRETGESHDLTGTIDEAVAYATEHSVALRGYLSDDPETQAAQGVKVTVDAAGDWRWV
ncbi:MAG: hypothetical protein EPO40_16655 [Myxococcaceae bacterium]|nr:MAG: hypothetical protein EPO40_16655 [Myxococcaceae bacterium]